LIERPSQWSERGRDGRPRGVRLAAEHPLEDAGRGPVTAIDFTPASNQPVKLG
jgi:hypothetical protein